MVYLRKKKVKGMDYLYLVKSIWNREKKTSMQVTVKYLGESKSVTRDDIPIEFRDDPKINSFLLQNTPQDRKKREKRTKLKRRNMTCKYNYKSISLRNKTMEKLEKLSVSIVKDKKLSNAKTVEHLIDHSFNTKETTGEHYGKIQKA